MSTGPGLMLHLGGSLGQGPGHRDIEDFDHTSLPNKNLDFSCFPVLFQVFHRFKSIWNLILMILVGLTCILDGSGSILWEFPIFAMESLASLESLESWHPWNPRTLWTLGSLASLESLEILEIW